MLREALDFPTSGDRGSATLLVGSGLLLLSALLGWGSILAPPLLAVVLVLQVALRGYYVRVLRVTAVEADPTAPSFGDVGPLFRDGVAAVVVSLVYLLPTLLLVGVAAGGNFASAVENPLRFTDPTSVAAVETIGSLAALLALFSLLAALYLVPGAVTLYAHDGRVRSAFNLRRVLSGAVSEDYAVGWVLSVVLQALLFPIVLFLYSLLVGVVLHFLLAVAVRYVWGSSFGAAMGFEPPTVEKAGITPESGTGSPGVEQSSTATPPSTEAGPDAVESTVAFDDGSADVSDETSSSDDSADVPDASVAAADEPSDTPDTSQAPTDERPPADTTGGGTDTSSPEDEPSETDAESTPDVGSRDPMADEGAN